MSGYDPFWICDWQQDVAYEMDKLGFDNFDDYAAYCEDLKNDIQIQDYESKMGF